MYNVLRMLTCLAGLLLYEYDGYYEGILGFWVSLLVFLGSCYVDRLNDAGLVRLLPRNVGTLAKQVE